MAVMTFDLCNFHKRTEPYPHVFSFKKTMNMDYYNSLEVRFKGNVTKEEAFERLKIRTSNEYFNEVHTAQISAISFSEYMFPAYKYILPDVLMDDWMSIMCPHKEGKRDHSLHQPLTAYIVAEILGVFDKTSELKINGDSFLSKCVEMILDNDNEHTAYLRDYFMGLYQKKFPLKSQVSKKIWGETVFEQSAIMAALFHDIGYPWQFMNLLSKGPGHVEMNGGYSNAANDVFNEIASRLLIYPFYGYSMSSFKYPIVNANKKVLKQIDDAISKTHGFPGALAFTYLNDIVRNNPSSYNFEGATSRFVQDWASVAIMMHDMPCMYRNRKGVVENPHYRLRIDTDPLSCLIAMADILEEFGRPSAGFKSYNKGVVTRYTYPCTKTEVDVTGNTMVITYTYKKGFSLANNREEREKEVDEYFNNRDGFVDLSAIGIEKVDCVVKEEQVI